MSDFIERLPKTNAATSLEVYRAIIYDRESNGLLMVKRSIKDTYLPGYYEFPGGKVDPGEDGITTLRREIEEETGLIIEPLAESVQQSEIYVERKPIVSGFHKGLEHVSYFIVSRVVSGEFMLSHEHDDYVWDHVTQAPTRGPVVRNCSTALEKFQNLWALSNTK
ncbi:MAG: hypothetical protein JWN28_173 [Candidatus Saccharibacteria bacterium]|nr:hypothetical protein [Candidatus Saccharibacteria bacterium]